MTKLKSVAAAVSATALGLALAAGASAQTNTTACDKLTGKNRSDCMAQLNSGDHAGTSGNTYQTPRGATQGGAMSQGRDSARGSTGTPRPGAPAGVGESQSGPATAERPVPGKADSRMNDSTAGSAKAK